MERRSTSSAPAAASASSQQAAPTSGQEAPTSPREPAPSPQGPEAASPAPKKKARDPLLDNARAILIALVVVGHTLEQIHTPLAEIVYTWIYSFHMPAFVVITGFLSRSYRSEPRQVARLLTSMLIPYLIFQVIHTVENNVIDGKPISISLWDPSWTMWFLLALVFWRLFTPVLRVLRYPLVFAVAISVIAPLDSQVGTELTWARVLSFLPFFVLGFVATPEHLRKLRDLPGARAIGAVALVGAFLVAVLTHDMFSTDIFTLSRSYADMDVAAWYGVVTRMMVLVCGTVLSLAVVMVSPRRHHWYTEIGVQSLTIYLAHAALLQIPRNLEWSDAVTKDWQTVIAVAMALALVVLLSRGPVVRALSWVTSPPIEKFLVREPEGRSTAPATTKP